MSQNQSISRRAYTATYTFTGKPSEETRKVLVEAGFQFDARSRQWYRREEENAVLTEEEVAKQLAA